MRNGEQRGVWCVDKRVIEIYKVDWRGRDLRWGGGGG